jgi:hypothetical protein
MAIDALAYNITNDMKDKSTRKKLKKKLKKKKFKIKQQQKQRRSIFSHYLGDMAVNVCNQNDGRNKTSPGFNSPTIKDSA